MHDLDPEGIRWWQSLTTVEAHGLGALDPVVVLPVAAIEQHGPHLPLSTDLDIGLGLIASAFEILPEDFPAWVMPPQSVGCSREHIDFAGTISIDSELLIALIVEAGAGLAACGVRRLVLSNSHGGNRHALEEAGLRLREEHGMLVVKASWFRFPRPAEPEIPESEWTHGFHGGAVETAMMLHFRPDLVRMDQAREALSLGEDLERTLRHVRPEGAVTFSWMAGDLNPTGVVGDTRRASESLGARLVHHYANILAEVIRDAREFPLDRLV